MTKKSSVNNQSLLGVYSLISEKITQLPDLKSNLDEVLLILRRVTKCHHLAIRIIDAKGNIPFYSYLGLEREFLESEHWITLKDCLCGYVARGEVEKSYPFITDHGSFTTSHMTQFMARIPHQHPEMKKNALRGVCAKSGYESVAIIPVKFGGKIIAELYLADEKKDMLSQEMIDFLEKVSIQIGIAIQNSQLYTELSDSKRRLMELFNSAPIGIVELDTKGHFIQINSKGAKLLGYSSPQMLLDHNIKVSDLHVEREDWEAFIETVDTRETVVNQILSFLIGREKLYFEFSLIAIKDSRGNITGYRGTFRDITDSVRLEQERLEKARTESLKNRYYQETQVLKEELKAEHPFEEMVGISKAVQGVKKAIEQVAPTDTTVLIKGETGVGKELVARYIHELSPRNERILVKVNCAALSEGLITSELFGHEKGAFTGAIMRRIGRFEYADGATIFLDEIGDLPLETQAMLLRVLQDGEFERVGSSKTIKVNVRLIAATNRDLNLLVEEKKFRQDLFFRLNVFPIDIPPLRERRDDIPLLTAYFLEVYSRKIGKNVDKIKDEVLQLFLDYFWPGNVRELQNVIEHSLVISKGEYLEVPEAYFVDKTTMRERQSYLSLQEYEKQYIEEVLQQTSGIIYGLKGAAKILGLKPSTLQSRMKKLGIKKTKDY
ncbi:MAG: sigma 54-interacting transcriptional regulator [Candidatus Aminicenantes bacterium]|nr:sigma 54-interacting transcriptional regulator [Candidatus Aminicenantes bacterium]